MGDRVTPEEEAELRKDIKELQSAVRRRSRIQNALAILLGVVVFRVVVTTWEVDGQLGAYKIKASSGPGAEWIVDVIKVGLPIVGPLLAAAALVPESARAEVIGKFLSSKN